MKILFCLFFILIFKFFALYDIQNVYLQFQQPLLRITLEQPSPTVEEYEKNLTKMQNMAQNFTDFNSWKEISFKHKVTGKIVKWKDLSDYEKTMFCLFMAERSTTYFAKMDLYWQNELNEFNKPNHKLISMPNPKNEKQKPASKEDVEKFIQDLTLIRKKFAKEHEQFMENSIKNYEKEIPEKEREKMLNSLREYHDSHQLIKRSSDMD